MILTFFFHILLSCVFFFVTVHGDSPSEVMRRVREIDFDMNQNTWRFISKSGKDMVNRLLTSNPEERLTLTEAMSHDWWDDASRNLSPLPSDVITSIRVSESDNKIMRKALLIVTKGIQNLPEFDELRAAFSTFDYDCDGSITVEELGQALKTLNVTMNSDDLEAIVEEIDQDQDGKISFDEFLAAAINKEQLLDEKRLNHAFNYFDMDSSGKLDVDELFAITGNMDEARSAIAEYDKDEDGEINFQGTNIDKIGYILKTKRTQSLNLNQHFLFFLFSFSLFSFFLKQQNLAT